MHNRNVLPIFRAAVAFSCPEAQRGNFVAFMGRQNIPFENPYPNPHSAQSPFHRSAEWRLVLVSNALLFHYLTESVL